MIGTVEHVALGRWGEHREGAPLIAVAARGAYDRFDGLLSSIPAYSESAWHGTVADVDAFGPVLGPLALDFRRLSLLTAPSAAALLLLTVAPLDRCVVVEWNPPPLPSFTAPGGLPHVDEVPAMSRGRWRPSVLEPRTVWAGCSDDVADFGAILAPVLEDVRRLGLLVAPTGFVSLFFDPRPAPGERTRAITWCPSAPDRFERRSLRAGTDFRATDLTHGRVVETFASSAPNAAVLADWPDLALHATLAVRRRISVMADQSRPLDRNREAELLRDLGEIAGVVAYLLEPDGER